MPDRILVVDDEQDIRDLVAATLEDEGYECNKAEDGSAALKVLDSSQPFDLIITDLQMPKLTGLEFLSKVREQNISTPVIVLTAYGSKESAIEALRLGAYDFLEKPFNIPELLDHIKSAVEYNKQTLNKIAFLESKRKAAQRQHQKIAIR